MAWIQINGERVETIGEVNENQISPWTQKISTSGKASLSDFAPCSTFEWSDLRGGLGLDRIEEESDRFTWSTSVETTKKGGITLGALATNAGSLGASAVKIIEFESAIYFIANSVCSYWDGNSIETADAAPLATPSDAIVAQDGTDTYLVVCNGANIRYATVGYGGSKDWGVLSTSDVKYMCMHDKRLMGVNSTGNTIYYSSRDNVDSSAGGAMDSFNISGMWSAAYDLFEGKTLTTDEPCLYMVTDIGLVAIDFWTRVAYLMEVRYPKTSNAICGMYWNSYVFASTGMGISKVTPSAVEQFGPDADDGLNTSYVGYIKDMIGISHWAVIAVSNATYSTILKRHESSGGWHEVYSGNSTIYAICHSMLDSPGRLWFGYGNSIYYIQFPDTTHDVTKVSGYTYANTGTLDLPRLSVVSVIPKIAVAFEGLTSGCSANETINIQYKCDADANYTSAGTWNSNGHPTKIDLGSYLGVAFNDIQPRVVLARGASNSQLAPILKSLVLKYISNSPIVSQWTFNIPALGNETKRIINYLETARDNTTLVTFSVDDGDTTRYVKVESLPCRIINEKTQEKAYVVTVNEVD